MKTPAKIRGLVVPLAVLLVMAAGCGGGGTVAGTSPEIAQKPSLTFVAQPSSITSGASSTLTWNATSASSVTIAGLGTFAPTGSTSVSPSSTLTYSASATGSGGVANASVKVTVNPAPPPPAPPPPPLPPPPPSLPQFGHVFIVVEENHGYTSVIGSSAMPYLNSLASQYGLAAQYYANAHPSIGNYFMMTTGQTITNNDSYNKTVTADNVVRHLISAGKTWKSYAESLPKVGYSGFDVYPYVKRHNPLAFFSDVVNSSTEVNNLVPFSQFPSDLANGQVPQFSMIVPNLLNDAHDGTLSQADSWLKSNIGPLIASATFQKDGLLIVVFDEGDPADLAHGGGQVACVIVSPLGKKAYQSMTLHQHQSILRLVLEGLGVSGFPGAAAGAPDMAEFFN